MESTARTNAASEMAKQYSLAEILGIWVLAAVPMGIPSWIIFPAVSPDFNSDPLGAGVTRLVWQRRVGDGTPGLLDKLANATLEDGAGMRFEPTVMAQDLATSVEVWSAAI